MKIDKIASLADVVLGAWLLLTVLLWRHSPQQAGTSIAVGIVALALGALAYARSYAWPRWIVAAVGVWLFVSPWVLAQWTWSVGTTIDSLVVGTLLFGFSALPTGRGRAIGGSPLRPSAESGPH